MSGLTCPRARALTLVACAVLFALPGAASACDGAPWIRLEVTAGEMAGNQAAEWVEIDRTGCVLSGYPSWDTRAGVYERTMSAAEIAGLAATLESQRIMAFDEKSVRDAIESSASKASGGQRMLFTISDADQYRLMLDQGGSWKTITWPSPRLELEHRRDIAVRAGVALELEGLQRLVTVLDAVRQHGDHPDKTRIAEEAP